jgi:sn-glycerol 3-phosphate transport system permease protein
MVFRDRFVPYLLLAPQVVVTIVFFLWPAVQAIYQSVLREDPFGLSRRFVWFENFDRLFADPTFWHSLGISVVFAIAVATLALGASLMLANAANHVIRGRSWYRILLIWPYAVAPAMAGVLWLFLFHPIYGVVAYALARVGSDWNPLLDSNQAMALVVLAATWKQISYNFIFFLAGLQAIPRSLLEAAAIDGAGPMRQFCTIVLPLLTPTDLLPAGHQPRLRLLRHLRDHPRGHPRRAPAAPPTSWSTRSSRRPSSAQDLGASAAQSVVLMAIVVSLTVLQFRSVERQGPLRMIENMAGGRAHRAVRPHDACCCSGRRDRRLPDLRRLRRLDADLAGGAAGADAAGARATTSIENY